MKIYIKDAYIKTKKESFKFKSIMTFWLIFYRKRFDSLYDSLTRGLRGKGALKDNYFLKSEKNKAVCKQCGRVHGTNYSKGGVKSIMDELNYCFSCSFWIEKKRIEDSKTFYIEGVRYHSGGKVNKPKRGGWGLGFGGREQKIRILKTGEIIETNNLWCQGDVPWFVKSIFPNNAEFLKT